ncbi:MAG: DUF4443 domain-containing protein [Nitrososphaerota archaeon]
MQPPSILISLLLDEQAVQRRGARPSYSTLDVLRALLLIRRVGLVSRAAMSEELGIGEGSVRSLVRKLALMGLVQVIRSGCTLTKTGEEFLSALSEHVAGPVRLDLRGVWRYPHSVGVSVRNGARFVGSGLEERDEAVRHGAEAAMVLTYETGRLLMPELEDLSTSYPDFSHHVNETMRPVDGDCIIIAGASTYGKAEAGALGAGLKLLKRIWGPSLTR